MIEQAEYVENRNQADRIGGQDEEEEGQDQRRPGRDPLLPDVWLDDGIAYEFHNRFQAVHETGGNESILLQIPTYRPRDDDEHQRSHDPQHQHVLGDRQIDAEHFGQMDQRFVDAAVGNVMNDRFAGIELGRVFGRLGGLGSVFLNRKHTYLFICSLAICSLDWDIWSFNQSINQSNDQMTR